MEITEKKPLPDFRRENEYAGEVIRIFNLLKTKMSEEEAVQSVADLEKYAKEDDEIVKKILINPRVVEQYEVGAYDGLELHALPPAKFPVHFILDGLWKLKNLNENKLSVFSHNGDNSYDRDGLIAWFNEDINFNKLRLEHLEKTGDLMVTDPTKVRIKKVETNKDPEDKKITLH